MGRQLKRVPLDFEWPLHKPWVGFINPLYKGKKCVCCDGTGYSAEARKLQDVWYGNVPYGHRRFKPEDRNSVPFTPEHPVVNARAVWNVDRSPDYYGISGRVVATMMQGDVEIEIVAEKVQDSEVVVARRAAAIKEEGQRLCNHYNDHWCYHLNQMDVDALVDGGRLYDFTHTWTQGIGWQPKDPPYHPTAEEVNAWAIGFGLGHDAGNQYVVVKALCDRHEFPFLCDKCNGRGDLWDSVEDKAAYEAWQNYEPPSGEGYQMWETVSEGSPISPVFAAPEELAKWLCTDRWLKDDRTRSVDKDTTYEQWMTFIVGDGWALSMLITGKGLQTGVEASADRNIAEGKCFKTT